MNVTKEGPWYEGDDLMNAPDIAELTARAIAMMGECRCILCGAEQPDDVTWQCYAMEVKKLETGASTDVEYRACPTCQPRVDAMLNF